jgi:hypothetical protein
MFILLVLVHFLQIRLESVALIAKERSGELAVALKYALPGTIYLSILLGLSYSERKGLSIPVSMACIGILCAGSTMVFSLGLLRNGTPQDLPEETLVKGTPGLILSRGNVDEVLLGTLESEGPWVISIPGQALRYQRLNEDGNDTLPKLSPMFFRNDSASLLGALNREVIAVSAQFDALMQESFTPCAIYLCSLIFLLSSLRFIFDISSWPLANLFLGALVFRGILALQTLLVTPSIQSIVQSLIGSWLSPEFISPLIFCSLGICIILYTGLIYLRRYRRLGEH